MFKAAYPWATLAQEEAERNHHKTLPTAGDEEVGNAGEDELSRDGYGDGKETRGVRATRTPGRRPLTDRPAGGRRGEETTY